MKKITLLLLLSTVFVFNIFSQTVSITSESDAFTEAETNVLTGTLDAALGVDVTIPVTFSGTATIDTDYSVTIPSLGEKSAILEQTANYGELEVHDDGRLFYLNGNTLRVYDIPSSTLTTYTLPRSYQYFKLSGNTFYAQDSYNIYSLDISTLSDITETNIVALPSGQYTNNSFSVEGSNILYNVYDSNLSTNQRLVYKKEGDNDPVLLYQGTSYFTPLLFNDRAYMFSGNSLYELIDGVYNYITYINNGNIDTNEIKVHNAEVYARSYVYSSASNSYIYSVSKLNFESASNVEPVLTTGSTNITTFNFYNGNILTQENFYVNNITTYGSFLYQLTPQIKILAGETIGTITFTGIDDQSDEIDETINVTPGTPSNATLADASVIPLSIVDNDDAPIITFALSAASIVEGSSDSVTLTATPSAVSGQEITLTYSLVTPQEGTALLDTDYSVSATTLVIPANAASASITISSIDDTEIEILETIIFTFTAPENATIEDGNETVTLNVDSDDNPEITSIAADPSSFEESASSIVTMTINTPSSRDVTIPVTISGTATIDTDYTFLSPTLGERSTVLEQTANYGNLEVHDDGRLFYLNGNILRVYDIPSSTLTTSSLPRSYYSFKLSGNTLYAKDYNTIYSLDISTLSANITETTIVEPDSGQEINSFSVEGNNILYNLYDYNLSTNQRLVYKKEGDNDPILLYQGTSSYTPLLFNDRAYMFSGSQLYELVDEVYISVANYGYSTSTAPNGININTLKVYNGEVYAKAGYYNQNYTQYLSGIIKLSLNNNSTNYAFLPITGSESIQSFGIYNGNLITQESFVVNNLTAYGSFLYQLTPQIKILAGETTGTITFTGIDDESDEIDETIDVTPGTPSNATLADASVVPLFIVDNDDAPTITFALSAASIVEDSSDSVTLTATPSVVSGQEITLTYVISGDSSADPSEYTVSEETLVIPANAASASITISPDGTDTLVEPLETIIFTFTALENATIEDGNETVTLNLLSEDAPVSAIVATEDEIAEELGTTNLTITIDEPSSFDLIVPLTLTGAASFNIDYTTNFPTEGAESLVMSKNPTQYNRFETLEDGRFIFLNNYQLTVYDPSTTSTSQYTLNTENGLTYFDVMQVSGNTIYLQSSTHLSKLEVSDLSDATTAGTDQIQLTEVQELPSNANYFYGDFSVENNTVLYQTYAYNSGNIYSVYKKVGDEDPIELYSGYQNANKLFLFNDRVYRADGQYIYELNNGQYSNSIYYNTNEFLFMKSYNGIAYFLVYDYNDGSREVHRIDIENDIINGVGGNLGSSTIVNYQLGEDTNLVYNFAFDTAGNILLYNRVDPDNQFTVYSYQLSPEISIAAGELSGNFNFTAISDEYYEATEDIIVTPGVPENGTLSNENPITINILDDDNPPSVSFELSQQSIMENSETSVTLTATVDNQSGVEITIPLNMSGSANYQTGDENFPDEYSLSAQSIVIAPNSTTGSITIGTYEIDDDEVETSETIIFTFGVIQVGAEGATGTALTPNITLNLLSEDFPTIGSVNVVNEVSSITEGESTSITVNINSPGSEDIYVPISTSGTAEINIDYTIESPATGEETLLVDVSDNYNLYSKFGVLDDGRIVGLTGNSLTIKDPNVETQNTAQLSNYYDHLYIDNNIIYVAKSNLISRIDITDISANTVDEETVVNIPTNNQLDYGFQVINNTIIFNTVDYQTGNRITYRKIGDADLQQIYIGTECCYRPLIVGDKIYQFESNGVKELVDGEFINYVGFNYNLDRSKMQVVNGQVIGMVSNISTYQPKIIDPTTGISTSMGYVLGQDVNSIQNFAVQSNGNLLMVNNLTYSLDSGAQDSSWGIYSYNFGTIIKILAGEIEGSVSLFATDDESFEPTEIVSLVTQTPSNAYLNENYELEITILDNDDVPDIAFEMSAESIVEGSSTDVLLTATVSETTPFEISIPFNLYDDSNPSTASEDEYTVSETEIIIPANSDTASISISTSSVENDEEVEVMETIIFTFGEIQVGTEAVGTTQTPSITLNLESDDDPIVTAVTVSPIEFAEHEFTTIEATISEPASRDVLVSFSLSGTATQNIDYDFDFTNSGTESLVLTSENQYNYFDLLEDGRVVFLNNTQLIVQDPNTSESYTVQLNAGYNDFEINGNNVYLKDSWAMAKIDVSDLNQAGTISETVLFTTPTNHQMEGTWDAEGDVLIFATWNTATNIRTIYKIVDESEPETLYSDTPGFSKLFYFNDNVYHHDGSNINILIDGTFEYFNTIISFYGYVQRLDIHNNQIYSMNYDYYTGSTLVYKLNLFEAGPTQECFYTPLVYNNSNSYASDFSFDQAGNLFTYSNGASGAGGGNVYSYQLAPQLKVLAGEVSGSITLNGIEDNLNAPGEETDETIDINFTSALNATIEESITNPAEPIIATILNNEISFTLVGTSQPNIISDEENVFFGVPSLEDSSIDWGDYDQDGDQDFAIMGYGNNDGKVTRIYNNDEGVFTIAPFALDGRSRGQLKWVDYNKDGYIDLVVSGVDNTPAPSTTIYKNSDGQQFTTSIDLALPNLYDTSMDFADFDNDGDIDFLINGRETDGQGSPTLKKYIYYREGENLVLADNFNGQFDESGIEGIIQIADIHNDGDQDIIGVGEQNYSKINSLIGGVNENQWYYWNWPQLEDPSLKVYGKTMYVMGRQDQATQIYKVNLESNGYQETLNGLEGLSSGDLDVGDYNNDGFSDIIVTGEAADFTPTTTLYDGSSAGYQENLNESISFDGFGLSTVKWVDYDNDGDLDLFVTGYGETGQATQLYRNNLLNKDNTASEAITNLVFEDLANGRVNLSWDTPSDDFSTELGYVIRLGTTPGGSELSNTESNLVTGERLITKSPDIYTNNYQLSLDPGVYYWSVQAVDDGLKGSVFSEEQTFQLTYEWKILNQGGIIDKSISPVSDPIVRLTDIDADNDMDLVYGSSSSGSANIYRLGDKRFDMFANSGLYTNNITDIKFLDVNNDFVQDIIVSSFNGVGQAGFKLFNSTSSGAFNEVFSGVALADSKIKLIDINNDGVQEIIHIGNLDPDAISDNLIVNVYEQTGGTFTGPLDISDQIENLTSGSFDFGNIDNDNDMDFVITGQGNNGLGSKVYLNETVYTETIAPIFTVSEMDGFGVGNSAPYSASQSSLDFIDFDNDGDVDIALTGQGFTGVIFKILVNNGLSGSALAFDELIPTGLYPVYNAKLEFGDFNGDGYADVLYSGNMIGIGETTKLAEYDPTLGTYVDSDFDLEGIIKASVAFGDMDGDNDLDFVISGENSANPGENIIKSYLNVRNESADVIASSGGSDFGPSIVSDLLTTTSEFIVNERPSIPDGLYTNQLGYDDETQTYVVEFGWNPSTDDHTLSAGLTYALKMGTSSGASDVMKVDALPNGYRLTAGKGNVEHQVQWILNLPEEVYYWSVQSIDASYSGSYFSETEVFSPAGSPIITITSPENNDVLPQGTSSVSVSFDIANFSLSEDGSADGYIKWMINGASQSPLYSSDDIDLDVEEGQSYFIEMELVDNEGDSLENAVQTSVTFSVSDGSEIAPFSLQGIIDFDVPSAGSDGKALHLLVGNSYIPDLSIYGLGIVNNGGGTDGQEYTFPSLSVEAGSHILVARNPDAMDEYMNASSNFDYVIYSEAMTQNGDDAIELFYNQEVIETFGDINVDGTGESWEYVDSWAYKVNGEWTYGELNCTDGSLTTCESSCPYPFIECGDIAYYDVTFSVNTANIEGGVGQNGMYVGGGVLGGANAYAMSDEDGDGTWVTVISLAAGTTGNYIFLNSPEYDGDWDTKEDLTGQECSDPNNYNDRILEPVTSDRTLLHCFGSCETDGTCSGLSNSDIGVLDMIIYPNPTDGRFVTIQTSVNGVKKVKVFDITGKRLIDTELNTDLLDVSLLGTGIYIVKVTINGQTEIAKLVVK